MRLLSATKWAVVISACVVSCGALTFVRATPNPKPTVDAADLPATAGVQHAREQRLRGAVVAVIMYVNRNDSNFPRNLGATLPYADEKLRQRVYLISDDEKKLDKPSEAAAAWVNEHTSFVYLGNSAMTWKRLDSVGASYETPITHEKFEGQDGKKVCVAFIDGHVEMIPVEAARKLADSAKQKFPEI